MTEDDIDQETLRDLLARTAQLRREIEPPAEAWDAIRHEIESPHKVQLAYWQRPAFLLAASLLLVASSSLVTALAIGTRGTSTVASRAETTSTGSLASHDDGAPESLAEFTAMENNYISSANRLSAMIEGGQVELTPQTVAKLRESVRVIDAAILEARRALAEDPANRQLMEMLSTSYSQKVDLLERTAEMGRS